MMLPNRKQNIQELSKKMLHREHSYILHKEREKLQTVVSHSSQTNAFASEESLLSFSGREWQPGWKHNLPILTKLISQHYLMNLTYTLSKTKAQKAT